MDDKPKHARQTVKRKRMTKVEFDDKSRKSFIEDDSHDNDEGQNVMLELQNSEIESSQKRLVRSNDTETPGLMH